MSQLCLVYSGAVAAASSAAVIGLALVARLSIAQTLTLTMAFAVVLALVWEYAGLDNRVASARLVARTAGADGRCDQVGMVYTAGCTPANATNCAFKEVGPGRVADVEPNPVADSAPGRVADVEPNPVAVSGPAEEPADINRLLDRARSVALDPGECESLARAGREGADLGEVDKALAVLMKLLIHPALLRDPDMRRELVEYQRRLHAKRAVLSMRASGQGGDIGQSAVEAQVQARLARLYSSLKEEYSDD